MSIPYSGVPNGEEWIEKLELLRKGDWRPIETAPKNEYFLGWSLIDDFQVLISDNEPGENNVKYFRNDDFCLYSPTHWVPLPKAPTI